MRFVFIIFLAMSSYVLAEEPLISLPPPIEPLSSDLIVEPPPPPKPNIIITFSLLGKTGIQPVSHPLDLEITFKNEGNAPVEQGLLSIGLSSAMVTSQIDEKISLNANEMKTKRLTLKAFKGSGEGTIAALVALPNGTGFREEFPLPFRDCTNRFTRALNELESTIRRPLLDKLYALRRADNSVTNIFHIAPDNDDKEAARIINLVRNNYGVDPALYSTSVIGDIAFRSIAEIKGYVTQSENLAICTGVKEITSFYEERNAPLTARLAVYARLKDKFYSAIKTAAPDFALSLADFRDDAKRRDAFLLLREGKYPETIKGFISNLIWLSEGEKRLLALDNGFKNLYGKIIEAQKLECVCGN